MIDELVDARTATVALTADLTDAPARTQYHPEFSPILWHVGHVAWQEEVWLLRRVGGHAPLRPELDAVLDSFVSVKSSRGGRLPPLAELRSYAQEVRERALALLEGLTFREDDPLLSGGHVVHFLANHERQHAEIIATVRLLGELYLPVRAEPVGRVASEAFDYASLPAARFPLGNARDPSGWDNERDEHEVEVESFALRRGVVTNREWLEWMTAGGYEDERLWDESGRLWLSQSAAESPLHWRASRDGWVERTLAGERPVAKDAPVAHVCFHEAKAFARFAAARLPTESEWERAAAWDDATVRKRRFAWGDEPASPERACLSCTHASAPAPGSFAPSPTGLFDLTGGVWEWTADRFAPYPGFRPQPYVGYSQPWFDHEHRVARGGSFMTAPANARTTFRNWYEPHIRQPALGVRLAKDL